MRTLILTLTMLTTTIANAQVSCITRTLPNGRHHRLRQQRPAFNAMRHPRIAERACHYRLQLKRYWADGLIDYQPQINGQHAMNGFQEIHRAPVIGECDCCGKRALLCQSWTSCSIETWACARCRFASKRSKQMTTQTKGWKYPGYYRHHTDWRSSGKRSTVG